MNLKKKAISLAIGLGLGLSVGYASAEEVYIPLISKGFQHQFWQVVKAGAEQAAKDLNVKVTFEGPESEAMVDKQIDMLSAAIAKKPAAIGYAALDAKAAIPLLKKAQAAKIPVICFDACVDSDIPLTLAATDNVAASAHAADKMAELIGGAGDVAYLGSDQTQTTGITRRDGFMNRMKEKYPNIKVVSMQFGGGDHLKSTEIAKTVMQANPNLKGYYGSNEGSIVGVLNAAKEMNRKLVIVGFDSGKSQKDAIASGMESGAITQNPYGMGYKTVEAAVKALKGEKLEKKIDTGFYWYDKSNMNEPKVAGVLYD